MNLRHPPAAHSKSVSNIVHSGVHMPTLSHPPALLCGRKESRYADHVRCLCNEEYVPSGTYVSPRYRSDHDHRRAGRYPL